MSRPKRYIICPVCEEEQEHHSKGCCKKCYYKVWAKNNRKPKPKAIWSQDDLEYICAYEKVETPNMLAIGIRKTVSEVLEKLDELKANGMYWEYKKSYERKLEE
ncbi:hypothetical protein [Sediminibacillus massiliensis]|uniref:hypothetical protein n=1 Tax=Sediminibacillus massiliensis TaxID=1926277 RepID=UPI000988534B|nr:hypothetical protein [Sediminibacillus massiliensis]